MFQWEQRAEELEIGRLGEELNGHPIYPVSVLCYAAPYVTNEVQSHLAWYTASKTELPRPKLSELRESSIFAVQGTCCMDTAVRSGKRESPLVGPRYRYFLDRPGLGLNS